MAFYFENGSGVCGFGSLDQVCQSCICGWFILVAYSIAASWCKSRRHETFSVQGKWQEVCWQCARCQQHPEVPCEFWMGTRVCVWAWIYIYIYIHMYVLCSFYASKYLCIYVSMCLWIYECMYACLSFCLSVCLYVRMYVCTYLSIYLPTCLSIYLCI